MNEAVEANLQAKLTEIANAQRKLQREHAQVCCSAVTFVTIMCFPYACCLYSLLL